MDLMRDFFFVRLTRSASYNMKYALEVPKLGHVSAASYIEQHGIEEWNRRFTFAFVRNPWDKLVSWHCYTKQCCKRKDVHYCEKDYGFGEWIRSGCPHHWTVEQGNPLTQLDWISHDGERVVEFVGRFENIECDFAVVCERIGSDAELKMKNRNHSLRSNYRDYYTRETRDLVADMFREDIEAFGYEF